MNRDFYTGSIDRVNVDFDQPTSGRYSMESVDSLPAGAPSPGGRTVGAANVEVPDDVADRPATIEITVSRDRLQPGERPADLQVVHYDEDRPDLDTLDSSVDETGPETVTISADTRGFSVFAVVVGEATATPTPTQTAAPTQMGTPDTETTQSTTEVATEASTTAPSLTDARKNTQTPASTTAGGAPGFGLTVTLAALIAGIAVLFRRSEG